MSHITSPKGFRSGKVGLWNNNALISLSNRLATDGNYNVFEVEAAIAEELKKFNLLLVVSSTKQSSCGRIKIKILYYPIAKPYKQERIFPLYSLPRFLTNKALFIDQKVLQLIKKCWIKKKQLFDMRFLLSKKKVQLNKWLTKSMFRGGMGKINWRLRLKKISRYKSKLKVQKTKNRWKKWLKPTNRINFKLISHILTNRIGRRVEISGYNVFNYLVKKFKKLTFKTHQQHIWGKQYHFNKWRYRSYYDVVNGLFLLTQFPKTENLVISILQDGLQKMHKQRLKPKYFFYFLDSVLKNMPELRDAFNAIKIIITGKLYGGRARTHRFIVGFGSIPLQSLTTNLCNEFGNLESKYGSFGLKLITWRKPLELKKAAELERKAKMSKF